MWTSREGVLTARMDPGCSAGRVIDVVRATFGGVPSFPVGRDVRVRLRKGGHRLSGRVWKWKGMGGR